MIWYNLLPCTCRRSGVRGRSEDAPICGQHKYTYIHTCVYIYIYIYLYIHLYADEASWIILYCSFHSKLFTVIIYFTVIYTLLLFIIYCFLSQGVIRTNADHPSQVSPKTKVNLLSGGFSLHNSTPKPHANTLELGTWMKHALENATLGLQCMYYCITYRSLISLAPFQTAKQVALAQRK